MDALKYTSADSRNRYGSILSAILLTGLFAGMLNAGASVIVFEVRPSRLFQFIASGIFGKEALVGGLLMALAGLIIHFLLAFAWTYLYFIAYPKVRLLAKHKILNGFVYGTFIWVMMNAVVIPLSHAVDGPLNLLQNIVGILIVTLSMGLPIAMLTHRYYSGETPETFTPSL